MSASLPVVRSALRTFAIYGVYIGASILFVIPFVWALSGSLKNPYQLELFPPEWIPDPVLWRNYAEIWTIVPLGRFMWNTFFIAVLSLVGQLFTASMVAYGFAKFRFPGRDVLFLLMLSTLMLPIHVSLIPRFVLFYKLKWVDTFLPLIVPNYFGGSAFAIFLLRQFFRNLPKEMDDAARIDGAGYWRIFFQILLPLSRSALIALTILGFLADWEDFLQPLIYLQSTEKLTVSIGLRFLAVTASSDISGDPTT
ncbi:MAG: carbohydrate ABC transporter permease, partial [Caldilineaceae bacterium SB0666_bin_21]|nr:carbohydrate ABC transporter permease [Caldilineaceae bacterium SB0666_bin_21]